ncbi:MAG TPA: hypothetical protein VHX38_00695 [Pseudonocardiaceae bacterium]|jgi:hypothetical protein|nr:hypothetical protein [Pseudonocardiaceae bacterium]
MFEYCQYCQEERSYGNRFCPGCEGALEAALAQANEAQRAVWATQQAASHVERGRHGGRRQVDYVFPAPPRRSIAPGVVVLLLVVGLIGIVLLVST